MKEKILNTIKNFDEISVLSITENACYEGKNYLYSVGAVLNLLNEKLELEICVPENWRIKLIDLYLKNFSSISLIPHVEKMGRVCIYEIEGLLIPVNIENVIEASIQRSIEILHKGIRGENRHDLIDEFDSYWSYIKDTKIVYTNLSHQNKMKNICFTDDRKPLGEIKSKGTYTQELSKRKFFSLYAADEYEELKKLKPMKTNASKRNKLKKPQQIKAKIGIFMEVCTKSFTFPPDWRIEFSYLWVNKVFEEGNVDFVSFNELYKKCNGNCLVIIDIKQPDGITNSVGLYLERKELSNMNGYAQFTSETKFIACSLVQCEVEYLLRRGSDSDINRSKILVLGVGSIGGYFVSELIKAGFINIDIVDNDYLGVENIYRHLLGMKYTKQKKVDAMKLYCETNYPATNLKTYTDTIEDLLSDDNAFFEQYDLVISAIGNHSVNRMINDFNIKMANKNPVLYLWNEALGIGSHAAFISNEYDGCYNCLFGEVNGIEYDRTSYIEKNQKLARKFNGCGSAYMPYGSTVSLTTVIMGIRIVKDYFAGLLEDNFLMSQKGDLKLAAAEGIILSKRYEEQKGNIKSIQSELFKNERCTSCGGEHEH